MSRRCLPGSNENPALEIVSHGNYHPVNTCLQDLLRNILLSNLLQKNWYQAFADCRTKGMDLASVENEEEYQQVLSQINALGKCINVNQLLSQKQYTRITIIIILNNILSKPHHRIKHLQLSFLLKFTSKTAIILFFLLEMV